MKKILTPVLTLIAFLSIATAAGIQVQPESFDLGTLTAGDTATQELNVTWSGEAPAVVQFTTEIVAEDTNSKGVNVSYSPERLALLPGETKSITMTFTTDTALMPDNFTVKPKAYTKIQEEVKRVGGGDDDDDEDESGGVDLPDNEDQQEGSDDGGLNETVLRKRLEERKTDLENFREQNQRLNQTINKLEQRLDNFTSINETGPPPTQENRVVGEAPVETLVLEVIRRVTGSLASVIGFPFRFFLG